MLEVQLRGGAKLHFGRRGKDVIESCGVPHTEVELIVVNCVSVDFSCSAASFQFSYPGRRRAGTLSFAMANIFSISAACGVTQLAMNGAYLNLLPQ